MLTLEQVAVPALLSLAKACAKARGVQLTTISRLCHGDPPALDKLEQGEGSITLRKFDAAMAWLNDENNWPAGVIIPAVDVPWSRLKKETTDARHHRQNGGRRRRKRG
jgi:hypothetical protein